MCLEKHLLLNKTWNATCKFHCNNYEFINFPDFCGDYCTVVVYLSISNRDSPPITKLFTRNHVFVKFCFLKLVTIKVCIPTILFELN